jgi:ribokinase
MQKKIITVGHCLYDIRNYVENFPETDQTAIMRMHPKVSGGGSAANVAVNLSKLGFSSGLIANIGNDRHGRYLLSELKKFKVDTSQVKVFRGMTGLSVIIIDNKGEVRIFIDYGVSDRKRKIDPDYIKESDFLHISGCALHMIESASKIASKYGIPISFDPGRAASKFGEKALSNVLKRAEYLIINRKELFAMVGSKEDSAIERLSTKYNLTCIIKQGAKEIAVKNKNQPFFYVEPFNVKPVDTLGAGDAFCAGFIAAINKKYSLYEAVRFANAVAAAKVLRKGAQSLPKLPTILKQFKVFL